MAQAIDLTAQRFGRLVAQGPAGTTMSGRMRWHCHCDCGATRCVSGSDLRRGVVTDCGCRAGTSHAVGRRTWHALYGYRATPSGLDVDERIAPEIRMVFALRRRGLALQAIADRLNGTGTSFEQRWYTMGRVDAILMNEHLYRGGRRGKRAEVWPKLLAPEAEVD